MVRLFCIRYAIVSFLSLALAACAPTALAQETQPAVTQTIVATETEIASATPEVSVTPENTPTITATATPENTATPDATATPEMTEQEKIRAEILAAGINLDDLANSENEWVKNFITIDNIQEDIDNYNFGTRKENWIITIVIDIEGVKNQEEFDQALVTDAGWKILSFAKLAYKMANGDWQIIKVPLSAYSVEEEVLWRKVPNTISGQMIYDQEDTEEYLNAFLVKKLVPEEGFARLWTLSNLSRDYHSGTGSIIKIFTGSSLDPKYANNDCIIGDLPRYSEEQLIYFRETGDPSIFGYQDSDGYYIYWPLVTFNADMSKLTNYNIEE
jgi:hypothetical protein